MTIFRAIGGLGNQLFVLSAALAHAKVFGVRIEIDDRLRAKGSKNGGPHKIESSLRDLEISGFEPVYSKINDLLFSLLDISTSVSERLFSATIREKVSPLYSSQSTGFDKAIFEKKAIYFRGYFQSYRYLDYLLDHDKTWSITLKQESSESSALKHELAKANFTALHIRRGDYTNLAATFGLLSSTYYRQAIDKLRGDGQLFPIKVFSDDSSIGLRSDFYDLFEEIGAEFVRTDDLTPPETLMAMSGAKSFVIANSSFSWWAAALSKSQSVVYPENWFRSEPQPLDLAFPAWSPVKSSWTSR